MAEKSRKREKNKKWGEKSREISNEWWDNLGEEEMIRVMSLKQ